MHITQLSRRFGLTRGTLLHYDRIGLLSPTGRTLANYREYTEADAARLEKIRLLRGAGLSLQDIARLLDAGDELLAPALEKRLRELDCEMEALRAQQRLAVSLLRRTPDLPAVPELGWDGWVALVKAAGLTLDDMREWHAHFERLSPEKHRRFLERLRIPEEDMTRLRRWGMLPAGPTP